jgi:hypothetical protein
MNKQLFGEDRIFKRNLVVINILLLYKFGEDQKRNGDLIT